MTIDAPVIPSALSPDISPAMVNTETVDRKLNRVLIFVGDMALPVQKRAMPDLAIGGENMGLNYKTLWASKFLLRKGELTLMQEGRDWVSPMIFGEQSSGVLSRQGIDPLSQRPYTDFAYPCYPGDEILGILSAHHSDFDKGIREVEVLRGITREDFYKEDFQRVIFNGSDYFPQWDKFLTMRPEERQPFVKISKLQRHIEKRAQEISDDTMQQVLEAYLISAEQYRVFGTAYLDRQTRLVKSPATNTGFVHNYSAYANMLFEQLEISRDEQMQRDLPQVAADPVRDAEMADMRKSLAQLTELITLQTQHSLGQAVKPVTETVVEAPVEAPVKADKPSYDVGVKVVANDTLEGVIVAKPFGRYKVQFADETTEMFDYEQLKPVNADNKSANST